MNIAGDHFGIFEFGKAARQDKLDDALFGHIRWLRDLFKDDLGYGMGFSGVGNISHETHVCGTGQESPPTAPGTSWVD